MEIFRKLARQASFRLEKDWFQWVVVEIFSLFVVGGRDGLVEWDWMETDGWIDEVDWW